MFVLDTNHFREVAIASVLGERLRERIARSEGVVVTSIITAEETLRGWLARLAAVADVSRQMTAYAELGAVILSLGDFSMLPWDSDCAARFKAFRAQGIRIGTMDLKIACITIEYDATLLTRNFVDFQKVPGLTVENWLD